MAEEQHSTGYNGWSNRATWGVNLHITNDQNAYGQALQFARETPQDYDLADILRDWMLELVDIAQERIRPEFVRLLCWDMLHVAFEDVNWMELARVIRSNLAEGVEV